MVGSVGGTNNLINMISLSYMQSSESQKMQGVGAPPPPPPPSGANGQTEDPLGVFDTVDTDSDGTISESEYATLSEGILEVTGSELNSDFSDFDIDGDGKLNGSELRSVLDEAGFAPPPPPPQQVIASYEAQNGSDAMFQTGDENLLSQLLEYLETSSGDLDITA